MSKVRCLVSSALLALAGLGAARADERVLAAGDPPLTQGMVDDYCRYVGWRWPQALHRSGGPQRLGQAVANDWKNGDRAQRERLAARDEAPGRYTERVRQAPGADGRPSARDLEALQRARLQQWNDARQLQIRALSNLQASHHETMMWIIANMRPSGRWEYNPATGRYDRYVPYPPRR